MGCNQRSESEGILMTSARLWTRIGAASLAIVMMTGAVWGQSLSSKIVERATPSDCENGSAALDVAADRMTFESTTRTFVFEDNVRIKRCTMTIVCDHLQVIHNADGSAITEIVATGNVHFQDGKRHIVAERANYFEAEQKLVLVGNPRAWDTNEHDALTGEEMVIFLQEEKVFVKRARVQFHPRKTTSPQAR